MKTLTIRGIDPELAEAIRSLAAKNKESINQTALKLLKEGTGLSYKPVFRTYDDLDDLAGGWTAEDVKAFEAVAEDFDKIDKELWE